MSFFSEYISTNTRYPDLIIAKFHCKTFDLFFEGNKNCTYIQNTTIITSFTMPFN